MTHVSLKVNYTNYIYFKKKLEKKKNVKASIVKNIRPFYYNKKCVFQKFHIENKRRKSPQGPMTMFWDTG